MIASRAAPVEIALDIPSCVALVIAIPLNLAKSCFPFAHTASIPMPYRASSFRILSKPLRRMVRRNEYPPTVGQYDQGARPSIQCKHFGWMGGPPDRTVQLCVGTRCCEPCDAGASKEFGSLRPGTALEWKR